MIIDKYNIKYKNERDLEVPAICELVSIHLSEISNLLDVGAHYSHQHYAYELRNILGTKQYDGIDILQDDITSMITDSYYTGNICDFHNAPYDYVSCISSIEHSGLTTYKQNDFRSEQIKVFTSLLNLTKKYLFMSFPFGLDHIYENQYANITDNILDKFSSIAVDHGFFIRESGFYFSEFAPGGEPWFQISRYEASQKPMIKEKGTQCVCLIEWKKRIE